MKRLFAVSLAALGTVLLAACDHSDNSTEAASSAAADAQIDSAGHALSAAAIHAAAGIKAAGDDLVAHGKDAAADAASDISTAASHASTQLHEDADKRRQN